MFLRREIFHAQGDLNKNSTLTEFLQLCNYETFDI
jgi:hypothetical protein